jgi:hypothetical protein
MKIGTEIWCMDMAMVVLLLSLWAYAADSNSSRPHPTRLYNRRSMSDPSKLALPPEPPVRPDPSECCNSGCNPCVFDAYEEALDEYRREMAEWERQSGKRKPAA